MSLRKQRGSTTQESGHVGRKCAVKQLKSGQPTNTKLNLKRQRKARESQNTLKVPERRQQSRRLLFQFLQVATQVYRLTADLDEADVAAIEYRQHQRNVSGVAVRVHAAHGSMARTATVACSGVPHKQIVTANNAIGSAPRTSLRFHRSISKPSLLDIGCDVDSDNSDQSLF